MVNAPPLPDRDAPTTPPGASAPWLSVIGFGEDGLDGLGAAARAALDEAEIIIGAARHIDILGPARAETRIWPVPFADGIAPLLELAGRPVAVLVSGDPFWFGAGASLAAHLPKAAWRAFPGVSSFSLAAARLGWRIEQTRCLGLHAAPLARMRPHIAPGARLIVLLRGPDAALEAARLLCEWGFGGSDLHLMSALGGPRETIARASAEDLAEGRPALPAHPAALAIEVRGDGRAIPLASGIADEFFDHDGQITKRPARALTLSALAPRPGELLWDIGAGAGSVGLEWLLSDPSCACTAIEANPERAARIKANARALGVDRLEVVLARAPDGLAGLPLPDVIFIGGGLSDALLDTLRKLAPGARLVANAVTLGSQAQLMRLAQEWGGDLLRIDLATPRKVGEAEIWQPAAPLVQLATRVPGKGGGEAMQS
ncbi:MAG: precorrin-6y C5,15-methyltransferase (decarboxylating) subunit CbiE [Paracoccus sp. (in: a-proteobacteria)]|nr:precorrin-6y C5,15-methyltransferase (decarboxylating) subunit CbiE [Paracoccus sp. (in: a-proteobacteria)]